MRFLLCLVVLLSCSPAFAQSPRSLHHDLNISLDPGKNRLSGVDRIRVEPGRSEALGFELSKIAQVIGVTVEGFDRSFIFDNGQLHVPILPRERSRVIDIAVEYSARFDDPVPEMPMNTDNPGYGVTGIISEKGAFLLEGAGWYPQVPGSRPTYKLTVEAPEGILAVSAGKCLGHETKGGKTYSTWEVDFPLQGLSLSAGAYIVRERMINGIHISTYFFASTQDLSDAYLDATARYLVFYENLFGPYPFPKFSVVENFFPTGYGFPSYTSLGSTVIRLPFILETSLGHEIAHCWWGNGVLVDYRQGNWSEGLTTYVADYLYKENSSAEEGRDYRLHILRNFSTLVDEDNDFPLARFQSRYDPASQAIGYGKGAMVFHMIRKMLGDTAFWEALREIYREKRFQKVSWQDFQKTFERHGQCDLGVFFDQWVNRKGAPRLSLDSVAAEPMGGLWKVRAFIVQKQPVYDLLLTVSLETESIRGSKTLSLSGPVTFFEAPSFGRPLRLLVDPDFHLFRALDPDEIPPSVNSVKSSGALIIVLSGRWKEGGKKVGKRLALSLGLRNHRTIDEDRLSEKDIKTHDLLFVGLPEKSPVPAIPQPEVTLEATRFNLLGESFDQPSDVFFGVFSHSKARDSVVALYLPLSSGAAEDGAGRITHYGRYSYLAFRAGKNEMKGTWPIAESPLIYSWDEKKWSNGVVE
jgi:hypothetical protein